MLPEREASVPKKNIGYGCLVSLAFLSKYAKCPIFISFIVNQIVCF